MTQNSNFSYELATEKNPDALWEIVRDPRKWWTGIFDETIEGKSEAVGDEFTFRAGGGVHYSKQRVNALMEQQLIEWEVIESVLTFLDDPAEWTGTKIRFELFPSGDGTKILFSHEGLTPDIECYDSCSNAWGQYMSKLKGIISD